MNLTKAQAVVATAVGCLTLAAGYAKVHPYLPASTVAVAASSRLLLVPDEIMAGDAKQAEEREQGDLATQLELVKLKIEFLLERKKNDGGLSENDQDELEILIEQRRIIMSRMKVIVS